VLKNNNVGALLNRLAENNLKSWWLVNNTTIDTCPHTREIGLDWNWLVIIDYTIQPER